MGGYRGGQDRVDGKWHRKVCGGWGWVRGIGVGVGIDENKTNTGLTAIGIEWTGKGVWGWCIRGAYVWGVGVDGEQTGHTHTYLPGVHREEGRVSMDGLGGGVGAGRVCVCGNGSACRMWCMYLYNIHLYASVLCVCVCAYIHTADTYTGCYRIISYQDLARW